MNRLFRYAMPLSMALCICTFSCAQKPIEVIPITILNHVDSINDGRRMVTSKRENYLIKNFQDTKDAEKYLDSFALKNRSADFSLYASYAINFYKESGETTVQIIMNYKKGLPPESKEDKVYEYNWWNNGQHFNRFKYKDGQIIPSDGKGITVIPLDN